MFPLKHRLRKEKDVLATIKKGRGVFHPVCGVKYRKNGLAYSRFTVVAGTKVHKRAVIRNRIKRQYRAILKEVQKDLALGVDVVLLVSKKAVDLEYAKKKELLVPVLKKAKLL